ncbi:MAG: 50S ribosomal protein L13 [Halobacteria archaeon]|nr:50S ribosomal protein L13 [Halobacteria archaeon]
MKPEADFNPEECRIVDGRQAILGRLASDVASSLLDGEKVVVVNAEDVVVSGERDDVIEKYRKKNELGSDQGPYFPKRPDGIVKRTIRGMVPHKKRRGREAMSNLRVYIGTPAEYEDADIEKVDDADMHRLGKGGVVKLGEISESIGANVTW